MWQKEMIKNIFNLKKSSSCNHRPPTDPLDLEWIPDQIIDLPVRCWECGRWITARQIYGSYKETCTYIVWRKYEEETNLMKREIYRKFLEITPDHITYGQMLELQDLISSVKNNND